VSFFCFEFTGLKEVRFFSQNKMYVAESCWLKCVVFPCMWRASLRFGAAKFSVTKETKRTVQGRAPCPIGVYVDLSSLRLREKK